MVRGVNSSDVYFASFWGVITAAEAAAAARYCCGERRLLLYCRPRLRRPRGARCGCLAVAPGKDAARNGGRIGAALLT